MKSPPSSLPESDDTDLPPLIPPKLFLEEELFPPHPSFLKVGSLTVILLRCSYPKLARKVVL